MGISKKDLDRGYLDTGYVPEEGDDLYSLDTMQAEEMKEDREEKAFAKKYDLPMEEDVGGFLERGRCDGRM